MNWICQNDVRGMSQIHQSDTIREIGPIRPNCTIGGMPQIRQNDTVKEMSWIPRNDIKEMYQNRLNDIVKEMRLIHQNGSIKGMSLIRLRGEMNFRNVVNPLNFITVDIRQEEQAIPVPIIGPGHQVLLLLQYLSQKSIF